MLLPIPPPFLTLRELLLLCNSLRSPQHGPVDLSFSDTYSTGSFTRSKADLLAEFGGCQDSSGNVMDACTRDVTGFSSGTDSLPADANEAVKKIGNVGMSWSELGSLAGAPEVRVGKACVLDDGVHCQYFRAYRALLTPQSLRCSSRSPMFGT